MKLEGEMMEHIQYRLLVTAIVAVIFMIGIGIMIAEKSTAGAIVCVIGTIASMGYGFATKRKLRKQ
jgi:O-antigen/teichoic acid export membrane protein